MVDRDSTLFLSVPSPIDVAPCNSGVFNRTVEPGFPYRPYRAPGPSHVATPTPTTIEMEVSQEPGKPDAPRV